MAIELFDGKFGTDYHGPRELSSLDLKYFPRGLIPVPFFGYRHGE